MTYFTLKESYLKGAFVDQFYTDTYKSPYKQNPFSDNVYIPSNVAGFIPYESKIVTLKPEEPLKEYQFYYANTTFNPSRIKSPEYMIYEITHQP